MPDDHRWEQIQEIFLQAVHRSSTDRPAYLCEACGDDLGLRAEVESLLVHDARADAGVFGSTDSGAESVAPSHSVRSLVGATIGSYVVKEVIACGGMGTVYLAEQGNPRRAVALKVLHPAMISPQAIRRFEFESQVLARLQHPNIACIFEAGVHSDALGASTQIPYFAMEYVAGAEPITKFAKQNKLGTREVLELFTLVCTAVHHGHQKGIIHRDLKPTNILVGADGVPKVIDFGVARTVDSDAALTTLRTDVGQIVGTLQYMSPEQCDADPDGLDIRTDIYSLGLVLYELLTGVRPYEVSSSTVYRATKIIKESCPPRPSSLNSTLHKNLEAVVVKAIEKQRESRYQSAADLSLDLRRYLQGEPVSARPLSAWVRATRWAARHPIVATSTSCAIAAAMIVVGTLTGIWFLGFRPDHIDVADHHKQARLYSIAGHVLHTWSTEEPGNLGFATLVDRPAPFGGGSMAVIGFQQALDNPFPRSVCAFDAHDVRPEHPTWERHVETAELPIKFRERGFVGEQFVPRFLLVADVFDERPGRELVVEFSHSPTAACVIRVYSVRGELLYEAWQFGGVMSWYWMGGPRLLVIAGHNAEARWDQRGIPDVHTDHPIVLFALRPRLGYFARDFLLSVPGETPLDPVWYRCLLPPNESGQSADPRLTSRPGAYDPERYVEFNIHVGITFPEEKRGGIGWVVDEFGGVVPESLIIGDNYEKNRAVLPDPTCFHLGELPPTQGSAP